LFPANIGPLLCLGLFPAQITPLMIPFSLFGPPLYYFALTEGIWGRTLGKRLVGLRVTTSAGAAIPVRRALARSFLFQALITLGVVAQMTAMRLGPSPIAGPLSGLL